MHFHWEYGLDEFHGLYLGGVICVAEPENQGRVKGAHYGTNCLLGDFGRCGIGTYSWQSNLGMGHTL
jgi:hypothetical protein